jgi:DNA-binding NtrC family response regulator
MMSNTEIVIIDDSFDMFDPLVIELKEHFPEANVTVKNNPNEGLNFVLANLSKKIIVLLDYNFKTGQPKGHDILLKIREKTSLVYVIIMTAKQFSTIPHGELIDFVNNDALAVVQNTVDTAEIMKLVSKAVQQLNVRVDCVLEQWISNHSEDKQNEPYLATTQGVMFTLKDILREIRQQTDFGRKMERNIMMLTVDLLTRGKKQVSDD